MLLRTSMLKTVAGLAAAAFIAAACSSGPEETDSISKAVEEMEKAIALAEQTQGPGAPAIWKLADEDTTIHIFGTVHILKPETEWRTETFDAAFNAADKIVMEIAMETPEAEMAVAQTMMRASVFDDGRTLADVLSEDELKLVQGAAKELGIPEAAIGVQEPWAVGLTFLNVQMMKDGYDPNSGVERVLTEEGRTQGKTFGSLETPEFQIGVFDGLSMDAQVEMLVEGTETMHLMDRQLTAMVNEWSDGDVEGLGAIVANPDVAGGDEFYDALFLERNTDWVPKIEALLDEPGKILIAVGSGHLAGPDSVITMLENKGHTITRVQ